MFLLVWLRMGALPVVYRSHRIFFRLVQLIGDDTSVWPSAMEKAKPSHLKFHNVISAKHKLPRAHRVIRNHTDHEVWHTKFRWFDNSHKKTANNSTTPRRIIHIHQIAIKRLDDENASKIANEKAKDLVATNERERLFIKQN